jgi:predicted aspartyl protease
VPLATFKLNSASAGGPTLASNTNNSAPFLPKRPWSQRRSTLHVLGKVNKIKCAWLLDTGSDVTCVSSRLPGVEKWKLTPPQSVPSTANGSPLQCLGEITANIEIGHVSKTNIRLLVIENLNAPAILGMDTLEKFACWFLWY